MPNETPQHPDSGIVLDVMPSGPASMAPTALVDAKVLGATPRSMGHVVALGGGVAPVCPPSPSPTKPGSIAAVTLPAIYKEYVAKVPVVGRIYPKGD